MRISVIDCKLIIIEQSDYEVNIIINDPCFGSHSWAQLELSAFRQGLWPRVAGWRTVNSLSSRLWSPTSQSSSSEQICLKFNVLKFRSSPSAVWGLRQIFIQTSPKCDLACWLQWNSRTLLSETSWNNTISRWESMAFWLCSLYSANITSGRARTLLRLPIISRLFFDASHFLWNYHTRP